MKRRGMWFLPETPDVIAMLAKQSQITLEGVDAFARWSTSEGDAVDAEAIRDAEHRADDCKFELRPPPRVDFIVTAAKTCWCVVPHWKSKCRGPVRAVSRRSARWPPSASTSRRSAT